MCLALSSAQQSLPITGSVSENAHLSRRPGSDGAASVYTQVRVLRVSMKRLAMLQHLAASEGSIRDRDGC